MAAIMTRLDKLHSEAHGWGASVKNFVDSTVGHVRSLLWLLLCAVSMVLLIACGNAANLLLARAASRMRELGVRVALGAGRSRITRQLLTEAILIGVAAGAIGIGLAFAFLRLLPLLDPGNIPRLREASLDTRVLLFTVAISLLTSVLTGVFPALAVSRLNLTDFLATTSSRSVAGAHNRIQSALIVVESALVVVLLASAGLFLRSYINVESVDTGFSQSTVTLNIALDPRYSHPQAVEFFRTLFARLQALPGVETVGAVSNLPLSNSEDLRMFAVDGYPNQKTQLAEARWATPGYFQAMGIPLIAGRLFTADEKPGSHTIIINQSFAGKYFAGRNPIGGRVSRQDDPTRWNTVVGVIGDVRHTSLEEPGEPQIYNPDMEFEGGYIAVRSSLPAKPLAATIRTILHSLDPNLAAGDIQTMGELESQATARRRFQTSLLTVFACCCIVSRAGRSLWPHGLFRQPPHPRSGYPHGSRRAAIRRADACAQEGRAPACAWARLRVGCLVVRHARHSGVSLWCRPARPNYNSVRLCFARGLRLDRGHDSRSPRRLHRSHASTSDGVGKALHGGNFCVSP